MLGTVLLVFYSHHHVEIKDDFNILFMELENLIENLIGSHMF